MNKNRDENTMWRVSISEGLTVRKARLYNYNSQIRFTSSQVVALDEAHVSIFQWSERLLIGKISSALIESDK